MTFEEWLATQEDYIRNIVHYHTVTPLEVILKAAWQAGYDAGCQSENELWMYADKVQFNGSMYVRTIDKD